MTEQFQSNGAETAPANSAGTRAPWSTPQVIVSELRDAAASNTNGSDVVSSAIPLGS